MADIADIANDRADADLARAIKAARASHQSIEYTGVCHNCGEPLPAPLRFCDDDCRDDFEHRAARRLSCQ